MTLYVHSYFRALPLQRACETRPGPNENDSETLQLTTGLMTLLVV
jgi:hypothetical protein